MFFESINPESITVTHGKHALKTFCSSFLTLSFKAIACLAMDLSLSEEQLNLFTSSCIRSHPCYRYKYDFSNKIWVNQQTTY
jgi:hypothetical protein